MMQQIRTTLRQSRSHLLQDAAGAAALMVLLVVGLHIPALT